MIELSEHFRLVADTGTVRAWTCDLDQRPSVISGLEVTLSEDERRRAARYGNPELRSRFVARRGFLRTLLGSLVGVKAHELVFRYGRSGKPFLMGHDLCFSSSSRGSTALFAVARGQCVGADIEYIDTQVPLDGVIAEHFTLGEMRAMCMLGVAREKRAFFRAWTGKEACAKAVGTGIGASLAGYDLSPQLLAFGAEQGIIKSPAEKAIRVSFLLPSPEYCAAVAVVLPTN